MRNIAAIFRREFAAYFNSVLGYIVVVVCLVLFWVFFFQLNDLFVGNVASMRGFFVVAPLVLVPVAPAITMRLLAEERRSGTMEVLMTLPLREGDVVLGKYLAALALVGVALALSFTYPLTVAMLGDLDLGPVVGGYLGLVLLAASYLAVGLLTSAWTSNQIVAFLGGLVACFFFWVIDKAVPALPPAVAGWAAQLGFDYHFATISRGVVDSRDLVYYASVVVVCLYVATLSLKVRRAS
ncbi:ABC transporter permease subunit [Myxococcota bacterium]|nr:ABC transporter permease subunit [Myxococcota bacterium]